MDIEKRVGKRWVILAGILLILIGVVYVIAGIYGVAYNRDIEDALIRGIYKTPAPDFPFQGCFRLGFGVVWLVVGGYVVRQAIKRTEEG